MLRSLRPRANKIERHLDGMGLWNHGYIGNSNTVIEPDVRNALTLPPFYAGTALRTDLISTLPLRLKANGKWVDAEAPIVVQPDPTEDVGTTLQKLEVSLILRGEFLCVLDQFDEFGYPNALKVVDPADASLLDSGTWVIHGKNYSRDQILHRASIMLPGDNRGISVIELFRRDLAGEQAARNFNREFYTSGAMPPAILQWKQEATPKQMSAVKATWRNVMAGPREPVAMPPGIEVKELKMTNQDSQFIESRRFTLSDIAFMVKVPPEFLNADGPKNTYANITDKRRDLLDLYMRKDMVLIEQAFSSLLPMFSAKFDTSDLLRMDPQKEAQLIASKGAWIIVNEARVLDGLEPFPPGDPRGDVLLAASAPGASVAPQDVDSDPSNDTAVLEGGPSNV